MSTRTVGDWKLKHINIRSLEASLSDFKDYVNRFKFDIIFVTETWLSVEVSDNSVCLSNYVLYREYRLGCGGSVAIYVHSSIATVIEIYSVDVADTEQLWLSIASFNRKLATGVVYRQPTYSVKNFLSIFEKALSDLYINHDDIICTGDFNVNLLGIDSSASKLFENTLNAFGLVQLVSDPTRVCATSSSLLDVFLCSEGVEV